MLIFIYLTILPKNVYSKENEAHTDTNQIPSISLIEAVALTSAYYATTMYIMSKTWYKDRPPVPFHFDNDWSGYLQIDKFGHAYGAYFYSFIGYHGLLDLGFSRTEALIYGGSLGLILQTPIEIMDGLHTGYGFSWGDMAANTIGSAIVVGQELLFDEQLIRYKFSYSDSKYIEQSNGYLGKSSFERIIKDYNGHTYWLSIPINKLIKNEILPSWLSVSAGYSANGMFGEYDNITHYNGVDIPQTTRYRQYLLSLDIDWTRIETDSKFLKTFFHALNFIKFPFPAIEYNSLGQTRAYWFYF